MVLQPDRRLRVRMAATLLALAIFTLAFVAGWVGSAVVVLGLFGAPAPIAAGIALVPLAGVALAEARSSVSAPPDAAPAPRNGRVNPVVRRFAQAADLPTPTVLRRESGTPAAYVVGYRPSTTTLVVTDGLLDVLDDAELRAVVAHELAHVANRDAAVMTAARIPATTAARLRDWADGPDDAKVERGRLRADDDRGLGAGALLAPVVFLVAGVAEALGLLLVGHLGRAREHAADHAAVALTGRPTALVTALEAMSAAIDEHPPQGASERERALLSAVAPPDPAPEEPIRLGPEGEREATYHYRSERFAARLRAAASTHPPMADRLARLRELERELETR